MSREHPSSSPPATTLDWEILGPIVALHRTREERAEFLGICALSLGELVERLQAAAARGEIVEVGKLAHAVKGSAATIGASRLAAAAGRLERAASVAPPAPGTTDELVQATRGACALTLRELSRADTETSQRLSAAVESRDRGRR